MAKPDKTLADYVAIAISPVLIMVLVGSLSFFLVEVWYGGEYSARLKWILFWFVLASVLVARIGIEQGREYAFGYGLALAVAVGLVITRFVDSPLIAWGLLAVIWWCANKLTWDCTLIDESVDASGEGLLQAARMSQSQDASSAEPPPAEESETASNQSKDQKKAHAPGLWVVYFSLAALPLFGVGQLLIPRAEVASRRTAFGYLWIYVAAALGLLLTTSFLGLRRYLRQRRLRMPAAMAASWIGMGAVLIGIILMIGLLLPRPDSDYSMSALASKIDSVSRDASRWALQRQDSGEGQGDARGKGEAKAEQQQDGEGRGQGDQDGARAGQQQQQENKEGGGGQGKNQGQGDGQGQGSGQQGQQGQGQKGQQPSGQGKGKDKQQQKKQDQQQQQQQGKAGEQQQQKQGNAKQQANRNSVERRSSANQSPPSSPPQNMTVDGLANIIKWLIYAAIATAIVLTLIWNWEKVSAAVAAFWKQLVDFWNSLFARDAKKEAAASKAEEEKVAEPPRPFSSFPNPFARGGSPHISHAELVRYSFEALQAWAQERQMPRSPDQTPLEFVRTIGERATPMSKEVGDLGQLYARLAYANQTPPPTCVHTLERLWRYMTAG